MYELMIINNYIHLNTNSNLYSPFSLFTDAWLTNMTMYIYDDFLYKPQYSDMNSTEFKAFESSFCDDVRI